MAVSRRTVANAVAARLSAVTNVAAYYAQVGRPIPGATGTPSDPQPKSGTDPRVKPYLIFYPGGGAPADDIDLGACNDDLTLVHRITVAGGDIEDVLAAADRVHAALHRWEPAVAGLVCGPLAPPPGYDPPLLTDLQYQPARLYLPLQYAHTVTAN